MLTNNEKGKKSMSAKSFNHNHSRDSTLNPRWPTPKLAGTDQQLHLLRVLLSGHKITAQVTNHMTDSIIAVASTTETEFIPQLKAMKNHIPRHRKFIDPKMASRIGEKLDVQLKEIGFDNVEIDLKEELSRPIHQQKMVSPLSRWFRSWLRWGEKVVGLVRARENGRRGKKNMGKTEEF